MRLLSSSLSHARVRRAARALGAALALTIVASGAAVSSAAPAAAEEAAPARVGTRVSLTPLRATVSPYQTTRHVATGKYSDGTPLRNSYIEFWVRPPSSQTWTLYKRVIVSTEGKAVVALAPRSTTYLQARIAPNAYRYSSTSSSALITVATFGQRVVQEASRHKGKPYQWGAAGPDRFDCSGFTMYVFSRLGKKLPHNSAQQYSVVRKVAKSSARVGDLVFIYSSSGRIGHVGIYAGNGTMWASPRTGSYVRHQTIYTSSYYVGRVG